MTHVVEYPRRPGMWFMPDLHNDGVNEYLVFQNKNWHNWLEGQHLELGKYSVRNDWDKWSSKQGSDFFSNKHAKFLLPMEFLT